MGLNEEAKKNIDEGDFYKSAKKEFRNIGLLLFLQIFIIFVLSSILGRESGSYGMIIATISGVIPFVVYRINYDDLSIREKEWTGKIFIKWFLFLYIVNITVLGISKGIFTWISPSITKSAVESLSEVTLTEPIAELLEVNLINLFLLVLYVCILAPVLEEIIFRGIILRSFEKYGKIFAVVGSAMLFGFSHGNPIQIPVTILMGVVLGFGTLLYSIRFSILLHICNNIFSMFFPLLFAEIPLAAVVIVAASMLSTLILLLKYRSQWKRFYLEEGAIDRKIMKSFLTSIPIFLYILFLAMLGILSL